MEIYRIDIASAMNKNNRIHKIISINDSGGSVLCAATACFLPGRDIFFLLDIFGYIWYDTSGQGGYDRGAGAKILSLRFAAGVELSFYPQPGHPLLVYSRQL
ncbi:MAG: hypothetical protein GX767_01865 [Firmicutes bacterium]|nr:hypothetical protein [Bacillota bacterium]